MKLSLGISNFLEEISSLSHSIVFLYFFALIAEEGFVISPCYSLELCIQMDQSHYYVLFSLLPYTCAAVQAFNPLFLNTSSAFHSHCAHALSSAFNALPTLPLCPHYLLGFSFMKPRFIWVLFFLPHGTKIHRT